MIGSGFALSKTTTLRSGSRSNRRTSSATVVAVIALAGLGTPKGAPQVRRGYVARLSGVHPAGEASRDLLDQPRIAVRIGEVQERSVAGALGVGARLPRLDRERRAVPDVTHVDV